MFCDIAMPDGSPSWADPRQVLTRALCKAGEAGFTCYVHPEIEFYLLRDLPDDGSPPVPADSGGYFDQASHDVAPHFRRNTIETLESMGISVEFSHHEGGPGQQEIDLRYADALTMADNLMTFRYVVKEVALTQGVRASFMPKPFSAAPGLGHAHALLAVRGRDERVPRPGRPLRALRRPARRSWPAILRHAREISAVTYQWVNSYKRLVVGGEAPTAVSWGHANRSALIRVPMYSPGKSSSRRIEVRTLDSACNPYLAYAVILGAGLTGVQKGYELPPATEDDVWALTDTERKAMGYELLPQNLTEALDVMERSELVAEFLGEHVFDFFLRNKRAEWDAYRRNVTPARAGDLPAGPLGGVHGTDRRILAGPGRVSAGVVVAADTDPGIRRLLRLAMVPTWIPRMRPRQRSWTQSRTLLNNRPCGAWWDGQGLSGRSIRWSTPSRGTASWPACRGRECAVASEMVKPSGGGLWSGQCDRPGSVAAGQSEVEEPAQVQRGDAVVEPQIVGAVPRNRSRRLRPATSQAIERSTIGRCRR